MGHFKAHALHAFDHRSRWCGTRDHGVNFMLNAGFHIRRGIVQHIQHNRCATEVRDFVFFNGAVNGIGAHMTQRYADPSCGGQRPREAPTVAMELWQNPQIHRVFAHIPGHDVIHGIQISAAVVVHHAFRITGGAGGVVQGNGIPLIGRQLPVKLAAGVLQQLFIGLRAQQFTAFVMLVVDADQNRFYGHHFQCFFGHFAKFTIHKQHLGFGVLQNKGNGFGVQTGINGIQNGTCHGNPKVSFKHGRNIRTQE